MQPIDPNTLFSIFEQGDEQIYREHGLEGTLKNPFVLIGMVLRGIENYQLMDIMYMRQYPQHYKKVRKVTKFKYYTKLYSYLERIDSTKFSKEFNIGESFDIDSVLRALNHLRIYFEKLEHYERCAVIKRFIDFTLQQGRPVLI